MCARVCARCERPFNALYCCGLQWASFPLLHTNFYMDNWIWKGKYNLYENPRSCKKQSSMLSPRKRGIMFVPALVCLSVCLFVCYQDHGLRGSASPVLTATGFVNGRWQFSTPPQNKYPLTDHQKNWYRWLRRRPLRLRQIWCKSVDWGLLGKSVKYNEFFFIYTLFSWTHLQVRPVDGFSRLMTQTTRNRARMCLLGFRWHCSPF